MAKLIPLKIQRNAHDGWNVIDSYTNEIVEAFDDRAEATEFVQSHTQGPDGDWEPDYEWIMESRGGDPETGFQRAQDNYEAFLGQNGSY